MEWNDLRFISHRHARQGLVYTATVRTALMAALDWAEEYAWEEEYALAHPPLEFVPVGRGMYKLASPPEALFDRFGPEPVSAWALRARFLRQAVEKLPPIHAACKLDRGYKTGLGALFVVDLPQLTIDNLAQVVRDFWEAGEQAYERAPVDFSRANTRNHQALLDMIQEQAAAWERMDHRARNLSP